MPSEPASKRTYVFIDGQNLFHIAKHAFGYKYPNYDPAKLAAYVCASKGWDVTKIFFYTGIPDVADDPFWNHFWVSKMAVMGTRGVIPFSRSLRYRNQVISLPGGNSTTILVGQEKGIDVRIALDVVKFARKAVYDVALIFSQDQDLSEAADEVRAISVEQNRWIKVACAYPVSPTFSNKRGINGTEWVKISRADYDQCLDPNNYRPPKI